MIESIPTKTGARDQLMSDLKTVIHDAEQWLRNGSMLTGEDLQQAREKFERTLILAKDTFVGLEQTVVERTKEAAKATDEYVHENPWTSIGVGAAVGVLIGLIVARK